MAPMRKSKPLVTRQCCCQDEIPNDTFTVKSVSGESYPILLLIRAVVLPTKILSSFRNRLNVRINDSNFFSQILIAAITAKTMVLQVWRPVQSISIIWDFCICIPDLPCFILSENPRRKVAVLPYYYTSYLTPAALGKGTLPGHVSASINVKQCVYWQRLPRAAVDPLSYKNMARFNHAQLLSLLVFPL